MMGSPGRDPFGPPPTSGEDSAGRHDSALRTHRPSAPALPSPTLKRARSGEVLGVRCRPRRNNIRTPFSSKDKRERRIRARD